MANGTTRLPKELLRSLMSDGDSSGAKCSTNIRTCCTEMVHRRLPVVFAFGSPA